MASKRLQLCADALPKHGAFMSISAPHTTRGVWIAASAYPRSSAGRRAQEDLDMLEDLELKVQKIGQRQNRPSQLNGGLAAIQRQLVKDGVVDVQDATAPSSAGQPAPSLADIAAAIEETNADASRLEALCSARDAAIAGRDVQQEEEEERQRQQARQRLLAPASAVASSSSQQAPVAISETAGADAADSAVTEARQQEPDASNAEELPAHQHSIASGPEVAKLSAEVQAPPASELEETAEELSVSTQPEETAAKQAVQQPATVKACVAVQCWTRPGEDLVLAGSIPALGNWQLAHALPLQWTTGGWWRADFDVPADAGRLEYKAVLLVGGRTIWEAGPNKVLDVPDAPEASSSHVFSV